MEIKRTPPLYLGFAAQGKVSGMTERRYPPGEVCPVSMLAGRPGAKCPVFTRVVIAARGYVRRGPWRTVSARSFGPVLLGVWLGRRLPNGDREIHPSRLTRSASDLQQFMRNLHTCLLCAVQLGYRLTYACDMA